MSTSSFDPSHLKKSSIPFSEDLSRNRQEEHSTAQSSREIEAVKQHEASTSNKRPNAASTCKKSTLMPDFFRNQLMRSPPKRRRRYRRRNSIYIRKENMEQWTNSFLNTLGEKGEIGNDEDEDHQSLPDLFLSHHSKGEIAGEGNVENAAAAEAKNNAKIYSDFHASWANPKDTQSFMELSLLSLDGKDNEDGEETEALKASHDKVGKVASNEDSITSFTASSSEWTTESSTCMDFR